MMDNTVPIVSPSSDIIQLMERNMRLVGKSLIFIFAIWYLFSILRYPSGGSILNTVDLIFHEAGHTLFFWAPKVIYMLAGSMMQIAVPLFLILYFAFRRELFSSSLLLLWLGNSLHGVGIYARDAFDRTLPLLGGDGVVHDWAYLSSALGLGKDVLTLGTALLVLAKIAIVVGIAGMLFSLWVEVSQKYITPPSLRRMS